MSLRSEDSLRLSVHGPGRSTLSHRPGLVVLLVLVAMVAACGSEEQTPREPLPITGNELTLTSPAFSEGEPIPARYSCDGEDVPPGLTWQDVPTGVESYALIMDDPDAPGRIWVHWVVYNIPADVRALPDGDGDPVGVQGENSWGDPGYGGPCPPGGEHRYFFKLYALDTELDLEAGADKEALLAAMEGHVLAEGQLMGRYERE